MGALDGRVAIITGAGRGIGREHALLFAREGASVVVNDLGGANDGSGSDSGPAQHVVDEIVGAGGKAVANTDNVADWTGAANLVAQAVGEFGRLDVLVNNAGILRDAFIANIEESQWDAVIAVHLKGHLAPLHHAAAYWKQQSKAGQPVHGSVINTASASGTFLPNPGQVNYGTAKAGIAAMTLVAAQELDRYGVRVNAIAPVARTRLTLATPGLGAMFAAPVAESELASEPSNTALPLRNEAAGSPPPSLRGDGSSEFDAFSPANISPLVAYLAAERCMLTGKLFAVQGGSIGLLAGWHSVRTTDTDKPWTIGEVEQRLADWT